MLPDETPEKERTANAGYAALQIAKALKTAENHEDAATRQRAAEKIDKWAAVLTGMLSGDLSVGSRNPIRDIPVWATPEVVTGGFVTGQLLAGGALQAHEEELLTRIGRPLEASERHALNGYFLSDAGLAELTLLLSSGYYEITVPEEGALLVVAWLVNNGHLEAARELIDVISPHFATLRFYPKPAERALKFDSRVYVESVGATKARIECITPSDQILAQREAIQVWIPFYDRIVGLFLETVNGDLPTIQPDAEGRWTSPDTRKYTITGGWPCQQFPTDWEERARAVCSEYAKLRTKHRRCGKPEKAEDSFARLLGYLRQCAEAP